MLIPLFFYIFENEQMQQRFSVIRYGKEYYVMIFLIFLHGNKGAKYADISAFYMEITGTSKHRTRDLMNDLIAADAVERVQTGREITYKLGNPILVECVAIQRRLEGRLNTLRSLCK